MKIFKYPKPAEWSNILKRPAFDNTKLYNSVELILQDIKKNGDSAVIKYTSRFDGIELEKLAVSATEIETAIREVPGSLKKAIELAYKNIKIFHEKQLAGACYAETTKGVRCWQKSVPIQKVGLYIPGGSAPLLSTVLMLGVPAVLAGCKEIILCTPPGKTGTIHPAILYVSNLLGISGIFKIGGVQAIAAMSYGTETVPKVNKVFGPGNQYVMAAKQLASRDAVAIDMPAGPSELAVMADNSANPSFVASDLLSQAEHGPDSQVILITHSEELISLVKKEVEIQLKKLPRKEIAEKALQNSKFILLRNEQDMLKMINVYAPEHLIIVCKNYMEIAEQIVNAGSIFLGNYSPESAGDYASGTNHTLPTNGWAHAYSGLNMDAFVKKITLQEISRQGLINIGSAITTMAEAENLQAHSNAVNIRLENEN